MKPEHCRGIVVTLSYTDSHSHKTWGEFLILHCTTYKFFNPFTGIEGGNVGLAISQALILTGMLQYGIRQTAEVVNQMTSVERVLQYNDIEKEPPFESQGGKT